jgi:phosphoglucosamine mutase
VSRKGSIFGTDGIRGTPRVFPLDSGTLRRLGSSLVELFRARGGRGRVVLGRDTRESGPWVEAQLLDGIASAGGAAELAGVIPTPGVAYLARAKGFDAGIVISASHNPFEDNGVKIFSSDGFKLSDDAEAEIERALAASGTGSKGEDQTPPAAAGDPGPESSGFVDAYASFLASTFSEKTPRALSVVLDCAHGAAGAVAPRVFSDLGFEVHAIANNPDGRNINDSCGALHPEGLARAVVEKKARLGVAFDGDADRAVFAGASGRVFDGDDVLYLVAARRGRAGALSHRTVVGTVMTNVALEEKFRQEGITLRRAPVGDRNVLEEMQRTGAVLGGEPSGHVIFLDLATTGDGLLTALQVAGVLAEENASLEDLLAPLEKCPQILKNLRVSSKPPLESLPHVSEAAARAGAALGASGRVLVRYSGTENKVRIMAEGPDAALLERVTEDLAKAFHREGISL